MEGSHQPAHQLILAPAALYLRTAGFQGILPAAVQNSARLTKLPVQGHFKEKANFAIHEVEEPSLLQQASMYHNASIVIQMHGAALGEAYHVSALPVS